MPNFRALSNIKGMASSGGQLLASHCSGLVFSLGYVMWDLDKARMGLAFSEYFGFSCPLIIHHLGLVQYVK
jgi:hypothetical protein